HPVLQPPPESALRRITGESGVAVGRACARPLQSGGAARSNLHLGIGHLLTAEEEVHRGGFAAAEVALRRLDTLYAIDAFAKHRRLAAELKIATQSGRRLTPSVLRALSALPTDAVGLPDAIVSAAHGAWLIRLGQFVQADRALRRAVAATSDLESSIAVFGRPDLELVLPVLYIGNRQLLGRCEEARQYKRDILLPRSPRSALTEAATRFAEGVLGDTSSAAGEFPFDLERAPLWSQGVISFLWASATQRLDRKSVG